MVVTMICQGVKTGRTSWPVEEISRVIGVWRNGALGRPAHFDGHFPESFANFTAMRYNTII